MRSVLLMIITGSLLAAPVYAQSVEVLPAPTEQPPTEQPVATRLTGNDVLVAFARAKGIIIPVAGTRAFARFLESLTPAALGITLDLLNDLRFIGQGPISSEQVIAAVLEFKRGTPPTQAQITAAITAGQVPDIINNNTALAAALAAEPINAPAAAAQADVTPTAP